MSKRRKRLIEKALQDDPCPPANLCTAYTGAVIAKSDRVHELVDRIMPPVEGDTNEKAEKT